MILKLKVYREGTSEQYGARTAPPSEIAMRCTFLVLPLLFTASLFAAEPDLAADIIKLGAPDPALRDDALKNITGLFKDTAAASKRPYAKDLLAQAADPDAAKRAAVLKRIADVFDTLRKIVTQQQAEALKAVASSDPEQKKKGLEFFVENINNTVEREIFYGEVENLASPDPKVVDAAQKKLLAGGEDAAPYIASSLDDERAVVKRACYELLKTLGPAAKTCANDLQFLLDSDDKSARRAASSLLEGLGADAAEVADDLVMYLDHDEKSVRRAAANILKKMGAAAKDQATDLADLIENEDKHTRGLATEILITMGPAAKGAIDTLAATLNDPANEPDMRERAASVLSSIGPDAKPVLDILKKNAADANPSVKTAVEAAIKTIDK